MKNAGQLPRRALLLLLTVCLLSTCPMVNAQTEDQGIKPGQGVSFCQVIGFNFEEVKVTYSGIGSMKVDPVLLAESTRLNSGYLNVFADGWIVQNMPVSVPEKDTGNENAGDEVTYFNLGLIDPEILDVEPENSRIIYWKPHLKLKNSRLL